MASTASPPGKRAPVRSVRAMLAETDDIFIFHHQSGIIPMPCAA